MKGWEGCQQRPWSLPPGCFYLQERNPSDDKRLCVLPEVLPDPTGYWLSPTRLLPTSESCPKWWVPYYRVVKQSSNLPGITSTCPISERRNESNPQQNKLYRIKYHLGHKGKWKTELAMMTLSKRSSSYFCNLVYPRTLLH